jgi:hypothetical protein
MLHLCTTSEVVMISGNKAEGGDDRHNKQHATELDHPRHLSERTTGKKSLGKTTGLYAS